MLVPLITAFVLTCLIEGIVICGFDPWRRWLLASVICNLATNPLINLILYPLYGHSLYALVFVLLEITAVITEGLIYKGIIKCKMRKCIVASLIANSVSCIGGIIIF
ncbi:MAG: hypothetical protein IJB24_07900 [Clostridia bacterium]|nr:hypothetical protein [Clostridia bacterium]MBQ4602767.1 hypothetical protein [Clostridia bacterium]